MSNTTINKPHRQQPSLLGPIVLIAIGVYFLLYNADLVPSLNWWAALRYWPLLFIFIGINIIVRQAPRPYGAILSLLTGLLVIIAFGYLLLFGGEAADTSRWGGLPAPNLQTEQIAFPIDDVTKAAVDISVNVLGLTLYALEDSRQLIEGEVFYFDRLLFDTSRQGSQATVSLDTEERGNWFMNPGNWNNVEASNPWQIGLNQQIPTDLKLWLNAGTSDLDLSELTLTHLSVESNASKTTLILPEGEYGASLETNAGSMVVTLPTTGQQEIDVDVSAGSLTLYLPENGQARLEVDLSLGSFSLDNGRFTQLSTDNGHEVWQTAGYEDAEDHIDLTIDASAGSVTVKTP